MNKLTLSMQVIQSQEQLFQCAFQNLLCETAVWKPISKVSKALPHGVLNKARMITACTGYREYFQRCPDMGISRMGFLACAETSIDLEFFPRVSVAGVDFQRYVFMRSSLLVLVYG